MAETSRPTTATLPARYPMPRDPMRKLGSAIAALFTADAPLAAARSVDVELRPAEGADLQVELNGDTLTIRGAVLTIRGAGDFAPPDRQKYYF